MRSADGRTIFKGWDKERDSNRYPVLRNDSIPLPGRLQLSLWAGLVKADDGYTFLIVWYLYLVCSHQAYHARDDTRPSGRNMLVRRRQSVALRTIDPCLAIARLRLEFVQLLSRISVLATTDKKYSCKPHHECCSYYYFPDELDSCVKQQTPPKAQSIDRRFMLTTKTSLNPTFPLCRGRGWATHPRNMTTGNHTSGIPQ